MAKYKNSRLFVLFLFIISNNVGCNNNITYSKIDDSTDVTFCEVGANKKGKDKLRVDTQRGMFRMSDTGRQQDFIRTSDYFGYIGQFPVVIANEKHLHGDSLKRWSGFGLNFTLKDKSKPFNELWVLEARRKINDLPEDTIGEGYFGSTERIPSLMRPGM